MGQTEPLLKKQAADKGVLRAEKENVSEKKDSPGTCNFSHSHDTQRQRGGFEDQLGRKVPDRYKKNKDAFIYIYIYRKKETTLERANTKYIKLRLNNHHFVLNTPIIYSITFTPIKHQIVQLMVAVQSISHCTQQEKEKGGERMNRRKTAEKKESIE
uniref:WGS project CAEQ00000000 data, annotated contig 1705 n=1 Tax=Trypanosoma congolense (strain IL3000) TaxID=1068625 RepID=F9W849_TRYCI|nr:unnamed protein product [Trypanosoma congolense IL3000]